MAVDVLFGNILCNILTNDSDIMHEILSNSTIARIKFKQYLFKHNLGNFNIQPSFLLGYVVAHLL